jgi:hypothetical protein
MQESRTFLEMADLFAYVWKNIGGGSVVLLCVRARQGHGTAKFHENHTSGGGEAPFAHEYPSIVRTHHPQYQSVEAPAQQGGAARGSTLLGDPYARARG